MFGNKHVPSGVLLLALFMSGLSPLASAKDMSTLQTALQISLDEVKAAEAERDADAQSVARTENEITRLKEQLDVQRKKAAKSEKRYIESRKRYNRAQAAFDQAWKK